MILVLLLHLPPPSSPSNPKPHLQNPISQNPISSKRPQTHLLHRNNSQNPSQSPNPAAHSTKTSVTRLAATSDQWLRARGADYSWVLRSTIKKSKQVMGILKPIYVCSRNGYFETHSCLFWEKKKELQRRPKVCGQVVMLWDSKGIFSGKKLWFLTHVCR